MHYELNGSSAGLHSTLVVSHVLMHSLGHELHALVPVGTVKQASIEFRCQRRFATLGVVQGDVHPGVRLDTSCAVNTNNGGALVGNLDDK